MEKLLTCAASTTEKGKAGANAQKPTPGVDDFFFFEKKVPIKDLFNFFFLRKPFDYPYLIF